MKVVDRVPERIADWLEGADEPYEGPWPAWARTALWGLLALACFAIYALVMLGAWAQFSG